MGETTCLPPPGGRLVIPVVVLGPVAGVISGSWVWDNSLRMGFEMG